MKRHFSWILFLSLALNGAAWADANDPILPGPKARGAAEGLGVGSLIDTVTMALPPKSDGSGGDIVVWGYRRNGHSGNYNWNGNNVGFLNTEGTASDRLDNPRFGTVKDFKDPKHPLYGQKVIRLFTTGHTLFALTEEGELWAWGDSLHGTAGCVNTGYETGVNASNRFADYGVVYNTYTMPDGSRQRGPHYQARPCPIFGLKTPTAQVKKRVVYVDGGEYNVIAITDDGEVYTWGSGAFYQTTKNTRDKGVPFNITDYFVDDKGNPERVLLVGGAYEGQYAVSVDKAGRYTLWGWGHSYYGSLVSSPNDTTVQLPKRLTQYDSYAKDIVYVNGGFGWTGALLSDGRVVVSGISRSIGIGNGRGYVNNFIPRVIMGEGSPGNLPGATKLIARYIGGVAVPMDDPQALYTWGATDGAYSQVYGDVPTRRELAGKLKSVGATKEAVFYMTEEGRLYGVGYSHYGVINVCSDITISWDRQRNRWVNKNSMNWYHAPSSPGGYRIPYENWIDVTGVPFCDGSFPAGGDYNGQNRQSVRQWTGYDSGDGPVPTPLSGALTCQDSAKC